MTAAPRRLPGLDGLRGLAALYVVAHHVFLRAFPGYPVDNAPWWAGWLIYGRFAVVIFIVLSGLSLALSPSRHGWRLDGVAAFARRRARRILPAYWAALIFSVAVAWLIVPQPGQAVPGLRSIAVNGLLVQNLVGAPTPNRAFWSIAVEAQLYLLFPLLLIFLRRRGRLAMLATVTLVVVGIGILAPYSSRIGTFAIQSPPDMAALFAAGIVAAGIVTASRGRREWPWAWIGVAALAPVLVGIWILGSVWTLDHLIWIDLALGPAVACLLVGVATGRPRRLVGLLDTRPLRSLGGSSYSLYLTHAPIVVVLSTKVVAGRVPRGVPTFIVLLALAMPATILFARGFAAVFEGPWSRRVEPRGERVAQEHDVPDLADVGEGRAAAGVPGEEAVLHEPRGVRVPHEHRGDHELQLVHEVVGQKLGVDVATALDHQPLHAASGEILAQPAHLDAAATVDDGRDPPEPRARVTHGRPRAVDDLLGVALGEEGRRGVELGAAGHGHLHRRIREAAHRALVASHR